jgi:hypothetical protein
MKQVSASDILDIAMAGTSATLLARRWESALLVNVDNDTLARLMANEDAMKALMSIEGFRSLNTEIATIINLTDKVKKAKAKGDKLTPSDKKQMTDEEKEYKSKRKMIQEKLIKFATRVPIFMYLTDYREYSLKDVITQLEPGLFKRVTGLNIKDFELLCSLGVFNAGLMNEAVYQFKRYEDSSLSYTGIDKHKDENVGGYDTVLTSEEYQKLFGYQQGSMTAFRQALDLPDTDFDIPESDDDENAYEPEPVRATAKPSVIAQPQSKTTHSAPNEDYSFVKPGLTVYHKTFGEGRVVKVIEDKRDGKIIIAFGKAEKMFLFPSAFGDGFLKVE